MNSYLYVIMGVLILLIIIIVATYEYRIHKFSRHFGRTLDQIIAGKDVELLITNETLESKLNHKLKRLLEITESITGKAREEKDELKSLLGDISHQIKTPIANIKMYNNILIERDVPEDKQKEFLKLSNLQIEKLDFLMDSMIKMSRLENGIIQLQPKSNMLIPVLANALAQISQKAEEKDIAIDVKCKDSIRANFDPKWTEEAIFNVIDNAVKYTKEGGKISIDVEELEMYIVINITDNGIGIEEKEQPMIFQRFYRSPKVQGVEGVGVGLALTREIISRQQGFIKVKSIPLEGSTFTIYLLK